MLIKKITGNQEKGFSVTNRNIETLAIPLSKDGKDQKLIKLLFI